jgi:hypothetical protein
VTTTSPFVPSIVGAGTLEADATGDDDVGSALSVMKT